MLSPVYDLWVIERIQMKRPSLLPVRALLSEVKSQSCSRTKPLLAFRLSLSFTQYEVSPHYIDIIVMMAASVF